MIRGDLTISELQAMEKLVVSAVESLKSSCVNAVANAPTMQGVTIVSTKPRCCIVNAATVFASGFSFSPDYFHQEAQAELVKQALSSAIYSWQISDRLTEMCQSGRVKIGGVKLPLNPNTIAALTPFLR